jgi:UDP-N-acetylglucosamine--N-acetylmuramyl-(pentapeptide) pyrophosphoryl-undecaprenol N-acetylglucosamine transferase
LSIEQTFRPLAAIACGGTGGHLFPGLAVGEQLLSRGCDVTLLISPKEVDQQAVQNLRDMTVVTLPAVGMGRGRLGEFLASMVKSHRAARALFRQRPPHAVLAMGGFTSAPPVLAGRSCGAATFLHESNAIPGRANRWLAHVVTQAFVGFPATAGRLHHHNILCTGTPVRPQFQPADTGACRMSLGLDARRPVLLVMGGSQGATAINDLVLAALPALADALPDLQFIHLAGPADASKVQAAYMQRGIRAVVRPFLTEMELALGAATTAISRSGGSSLAEFATMRVPALLVPYPAAADNHQFHNAQSFVETGAAFLLEQCTATAEQLVSLVRRLVADAALRASMAAALERWDVPHAAGLIAERIVATVEALSRGAWRRPSLARHDEVESLRQPRSHRNVAFRPLGVNLAAHPCAAMPVDH